MGVCTGDPMTSAQRQRQFKARQEELGLVQCNVWVPAHTFADVQTLAQLLRDNPDLTVGPLRNQRTGKLRALR